MREEPAHLIVQYHNETKHHLRRFARSLGYLDWATQPNPFRTFEGAATIDLIAPLLAARSVAGTGSQSWTGITFDATIDAGLPSPLETGLGAVSIFLRFSLGLSAWKQAGSSRWALRVNPSSGNLHPSEGYIVAGRGVMGDAPGVFHYAPDTHALERRAMFSEGAWRHLGGALPSGAFMAGLTSIHWREAWKYGERAFRYCQHDIGHAIAAMSVAAAMIGWRLCVLPDWSSEAMSALLGLDRREDFDPAEPEEPACLMIVTPGDVDDARLRESSDIVSAARAATWSGKANRLSADRVQWDWIDAAAEATRLPGVLGSRVRGTDAGRAIGDSPGKGHSLAKDVAFGKHDESTVRVGGRLGGLSVPSASRLLLQRRSAAAMDGSSSIDRERFLFMLRRTLPAGRPPLDAFWWTPRIHLVCFVHRVDGLEPGLYALARSADGLALLQRACREDFAWIRPEGVGEDLPLFLLAAIDARRVARQLSCAQDIASDGFFSLGMLAEFDSSLAHDGPGFYRHLFWEAGAIGQVLYLEAEAAGCRGTGIGCFFDDAVHEVLGLRDQQLQSLYHFTVGMPVDDPRLQTAPGYAWE